MNTNVSEWYEFARSTVERYQQEKLKEEESSYRKKREEQLKLIKEEYDVLEAKFKQLPKTEFLKFVYTTHPPKKEKHKLGEVKNKLITVSLFYSCVFTD